MSLGVIPELVEAVEDLYWTEVENSEDEDEEVGKLVLESSGERRVGY